MKDEADIATQEESLEKLLEQIIESAAHPSAPSSLEQQNLSHIVLEKEKVKRPRFPLIPVWLATLVLAAFFLGGALGFYWGNRDSHSPSLSALDIKLSTLTQEIQNLSKRFAPPSQEVIEPLTPPEGFEQLTPTATR